MACLTHQIRVRAFASAVLCAFGFLFGCEASSGVELEVSERDPSSCDGGECAACSAENPCPLGQRCSAGVCKPNARMDSGVDGSMSDAGVPDSQVRDGGMDGGDTPDAGECAELGRCTKQICDAGAINCVDNDLVQCNGDGTANTVIKGCAAGETCDKAKQRCNKCEPNEVLGCANPGAPNTCTCPDGCTGDGKGIAGCTQCVAGKFRCASRTISQKCDGTGLWNNDDTCTASAVRVCDANEASATYGKCISNEPVPVGRSTSGGVASKRLYEEGLYAQPIIAPPNVTLYDFGMWTTPASVGGGAYLSLHADSSGEPGALIARTGQFEIDPSSANLHAPTAAGVPLISGARYWIVAKISASSTESPTIYVNESSVAGNYHYGIQAFGIPRNLPANLTSPENGEVSIFIRVQR